MRRWLTISIVAVIPHAVLADGVLEEISTGAAGTGSRWVSNKLATIWDVDPQWQLRFDLSATRAYGRAADATHGGVYVGSLSAAFSPDDHWTLRFHGGRSPEFTARETVPLPIRDLPDGAPLPRAQLHAAASWTVLGVSVEYDGATDDVHSVSASLSVSETYFDAHHEIVSVQDWTGGGDAALGPAEAVMLCRITTCDRDAPGMLLPQSVQLGQFAVGASVTDMVDGDTDLSLDATYYLYGDDPLRPGYFALVTFDRSTRGSATSAPLLRNALGPSVTHRWGNVAASLSLSYSGYLDRQFDVGAGLSIQYKLAATGTRRLKLNAKLAADSHSDASYQFARSGSFAVGAQCTW